MIYTKHLTVLKSSIPIFLKLENTITNSRLDKTLSTLMPQYSRNFIQELIQMGFVMVDGKIASRKIRVRGGELIRIIPQLFQKNTFSLKPEKIDLEIIYEDQFILVINKQPGLVMHPGAGNLSGTLLNGLLYHYPQAAYIPRAGIVHRLDKNTSGLIVVAKTQETQIHLINQLKSRTVIRYYLALVWGKLTTSGKINSKIMRHTKNRIKMNISNSVHAKHAITHYYSFAHGILNKKDVSLIYCKLETGRTHQIRVHMQSIGYNLVGDPLYGKEHLLNVFSRQALHAWSLSFLHPKNDFPCTWKINIPQDFIDLLKDAGIKNKIDEIDITKKSI